MKTTKNELMEFLENIEITTNYGLSISEYMQVVENCIKSGNSDYSEIIYCVAMNIFKIGYLHGYRHYKDNGAKVIYDYTYMNSQPNNINKKLNEYIELGFYPDYEY